MTTKTKGRDGGNRDATPKLTDSHKHTATDPLVGWFNLAKPMQARQQKKRGGVRR